MRGLVLTLAATAGLLLYALGQTGKTDEFTGLWKVAKLLDIDGVLVDGSDADAKALVGKTIAITPEAAIVGGNKCAPHRAVIEESRSELITVNKLNGLTLGLPRRVKVANGMYGTLAKGVWLRNRQLEWLPVRGAPPQ
jgi:hypothetical protein